MLRLLMLVVTASFFSFLPSLHASRAFTKLNTIHRVEEFDRAELTVTKKGQSVNYRSSDDFVSGISFHSQMNFKNKKSLLATLEILLKDEENSAKQTELFRQIEQTKLLSKNEKINFLKSKIDRLPAPFAMLLADLTAEYDLDEAFKWKVLSQLRMQIDMFKCKDPSVVAGVELIEFYFLDSIFQKMVAQYYKNAGKSKSFTNEFLTEEYQQRTLAAIRPALEYHLKNPYQVRYPYWLANHGMKHINALFEKKNLVKSQVFLEKEDSQRLEEALITEFRSLIPKK